MACSNGGTKGAWDDSIKKEFMGACTKGRVDPITPVQMKNICQCSLDILEAKYAPSDLKSKEALKSAEKAGADCAMKEMQKK